MVVPELKLVDERLLLLDVMLRLLMDVLQDVLGELHSLELVLQRQPESLLISSSHGSNVIVAEASPQLHWVEGVAVGRWKVTSPGVKHVTSPGSYSM